MTPAQQELLNAVDSSNSLDDLAFQFQTTTSGIARRLNSLAKKDLVYRYNFEVYLTQKGRKNILSRVDNDQN